LDARAHLCPVCKTWQTAWRNWLPYLGAIVTAGTIVVSGITYTVTHLRRDPPPQVSLAILDMADPGSLSLLNTGNIDLLITDVQMYCKKEIIGAATQTVHKVIKRGEVLTVPLDNGAAGNAVPAGGEFTRHALPNHLGDDYGVAYYSAGHAYISLLKNVKNFKSVEAEGVVFYVPTSGTEQKNWEQRGVVIPLEGVMMRRKVPLAK